MTTSLSEITHLSRTFGRETKGGFLPQPLARGHAPGLAAEAFRLRHFRLAQTGRIELAPTATLCQHKLGHRHHQPDLRRVARRRQDDHGPARPADPSLRHRPDRQRELALQKPRLIPPPKDRIAGESVSPPTAPRRSPPRTEADAAEGSLLHADRGSRFHAD